MRQVLPHLLVPSRRGGVEGKYFNVSQTSAFQEMSVSKVPDQYPWYRVLYHTIYNNRNLIIFTLLILKYGEICHFGVEL